MHAPPQLLTIGHGTIEADRFLELLREQGIETLVDVRTVPKSRRHPHFAFDEMQRWVPAAGIVYRWERALGGFRKPRPDSPNVALRNASFRGYADYMQSAEFRAALDAVEAAARTQRLAIMCSESLWWRCHRRLVADVATLTDGFDVRHLMHDGKVVPHRTTEGARRDGERVTYDVVLE